MSTDGGEAGTSTGLQHQRVSKTGPQIITFMQGINSTMEDKNSDYLCPICFETIEEAHVTRCGHTFCYRCITRSLETVGRCPKCNINLTQQDIFPNFLLNELIAKYKTRAKNIATLDHSFASDGKGKGFLSTDTSIDISENLRSFLSSENPNLSLSDIDSLLELLSQRKQLLEAETCAAQNKLLYEFLRHLLTQKEEQNNQLQKEVVVIKRDIQEVENILKDLQKKCPKVEDLNKSSDCDSDNMQAIRKEMINLINVIGSSTMKSSEETDPVRMSNSPTNQNKYNTTNFALPVRRRRMHAHFEDFVECYFNSRAKELHFGGTTSESDSSGLDIFREDLVKFSRYNSLKPLATLNYSSDIFNPSNIVSSIEFDKDNEFFAIAGVTKRIKVFDYNTVIQGIVDLHYPCVEMTSSSKISCVSWNSYHKGILASSDYEGTVTIWDAITGQRTKVFHEHEKRCWSIDFNNVDTRLIASGSDDARVKLWSLNVDHSVASLEAKANVCCVKFNPRSSCHLAFGSADHCVHYYDLRSMKEALCIFKGHKKAVSYVKFVNEQEIVSASTDSQLKMWNINNPYCLRSFVGHINEKNFVGLATDGDYVACGSENNSLYVYYKGLTKQLFSYKFDAARSILDTQERRDEELNEFVSAVCWRQNSNVVVAANSQGIIKILELA
ncbi:E3 ubiquitin-protein ligase COP1-like [Phymastichus coffea]|uniref:E3 ubiquitin-protein ligase COP1-like n=1 Tax=Phymastichus coffea TaxID=108790 RepID=UPI00273CBCC2|nr:E3 ubiquitin-protein ligase COP1-like [Phymastichus coffea]XP_058790595.1 E3 ubiquitin-protein ligase COP1-like [Phymastichus coffea]XP_058790604.1 E3 ubiquitin-protein ligase COP1-like [Phymastichus coffea]XP_058790612.1 E3 ubiquitin-protein ligase COP1-like [Phymastichus coffea]